MRLLIKTNLTFKRKVEITVSMETAVKDTIELQLGVKVNVNKLPIPCKQGLIGQK